MQSHLLPSQQQLFSSFFILQYVCTFFYIHSFTHENLWSKFTYGLEGVPHLICFRGFLQDGIYTHNPIYEEPITKPDFICSLDFQQIQLSDLWIVEEHGQQGRVGNNFKIETARFAFYKKHRKSLHCFMI